jgi:hypothetical protein
VNGQTLNGTKPQGLRVLGEWQPIHIGGMHAANDETPTPTAPPEPAMDPVAAAEAEAIRLRAEAEADAVRATAEAEAEKLRIANERAAMRLEKERADHELRLTETRRRQEEVERQRAAANAAQQAEEEAEAEQAKEIATADDKWRAYAIRFAFVCGIVSLPVQMSFFWNPKAPWMAAAPVMLEGAAWVVHRGARAAVANRRPVWHYRLIVWLLAFVAAGINLYHGLHAFDPGTALATAFASIAGPGVWDLHEHGRIRKRDGALTRKERKARERAEKRAEAEKAAREAAVKAEKDAAAKAAREAAEELAKKREGLFPKVWPWAVKLAAALGETTVTEAVWKRAHKDVEGTDPGDSAEAQKLRNAAARKVADEQVNSQVPPTRRRGSVTGPPVRGVRRPGDTAPFVQAARTQAAITAKDTAQKDA